MNNDICLHAINGRMRIRLTNIKKSPQTASEVEQYLSQVEGIIRAKANPVTASLLVEFDSRLLSADQILERLGAAGYFNPGNNQNAYFGRTKHLIIENAAANVLAAAVLEIGLSMLLDSAIQVGIRAAISALA